ncbi:unnamed protein product [Didymodactylos carnosus]|uniref:MYND-type domain-containing protein n=1 Tax=Didymodactylos carnosus TaxID=1234261 RepID=A0A813VBM7_9BILA|nr:unnamed protein product [Didymodactylos carnosus]CAF0840467.1 unnamed protein product [Didymodactylos carnosus]CAF3590767.1 unnamed protein product [Didymodactylos carnosus]CAF3627808.1 unnamed protein product [Didymodactylos carnosus]
MTHYTSDSLQAMNEAKNILNSLKTTQTANKLSDNPRSYDFNVLNKYAKCGSQMAKKMCCALQRFQQALNIVMQSETLAEIQENAFISEFSQCCRTERIVAQISNIEMYKTINDIVDRVLQRCYNTSNTTISQVDEDVRICYATLHIDSPKSTLQFLGLCKQKYPKSTHFFKLSAIMNSSLRQDEASLHDINAGLEIDPNHDELLYQKAVSLNLLNRNADETIEAYRAFLAIAPADHFNVPASYYTIASCYLIHGRDDGSIDIVKKAFEEGEKAEKIQLPCFPPYEFNIKKLLQYFLNKQHPLSAAAAAPPLNNRKSRLIDSKRIEIIQKHREVQAMILYTMDNSKFPLQCFTRKPRLKQQTTKLLIGLKSITLREMNPTKDHIYTGYVLSVTIIEQAYSWTPSINLVIEDENLDCERMCVYGFLESQGEYFTNDVFTIGSKMNILSPYLRVAANDMKPVVRVDDFLSIIMQNESEQVIDMCRCCGESNSAHVCGRCKEARYCTKECQTTDWKIYGHKLICRKK